MAYTDWKKSGLCDENNANMYLLTIFKKQNVKINNN